jgi:hypothetical protein
LLGRDLLGRALALGGLRAARAVPLSRTDRHAIIDRVTEDDAEHESFEERVRSIARELSRSVERVTQLDMDELAEAVGVDPARAREWIDNAGRWFSGQAESLGGDVASWGPRPRDAAKDEDRPRGAGPHPLDLPTRDQGLALAALDSGRWTVEPGSNVIGTHGEGHDPSDAMGLVGELRARDWVAADGKVTLAGRHALSRWLEAATPAPPQSDSV